jgi:hypothetical protein
MRDVTAELKGLRLQGMASAWVDLADQGTLGSLESSRWLIEHLLTAETDGPGDALGEPSDECGQVPGAPGFGRL